MPNVLNGLFQAIHQDHLQPPTKFFFHSSVVNDEDNGEMWVLRLFATIDDAIMRWVSEISDKNLPAGESLLKEIIEGGMLHISLPAGGELSTLSAKSDLKLQFLRADDDPISITLKPSDETQDTTVLLEAAFSLLARKPTGSQSNRAELRAMRTELSNKDEEISALQTKVTNLKAAVARSSASDPKKKLLPSPKKPAGASALQPNAKRRKAVADEFAGSDSD